MKKLVLKGFEVQLIMLFFSFIIFATNEFTLSVLWVNILASVLLISIYLLLFYIDSFKITSDALAEGKKPALPIIANIIVYLIPIAIFVWCKAFPLHYKQAVMVKPGDLENGVKATVKYIDAIRQTAWFELYMFPFKGIYTMFGSKTLVHIITLLPMPIASFLGYFNAKRGVDLMNKLNNKLQKTIYRDK